MFCVTTKSKFSFGFAERQNISLLFDRKPPQICDFYFLFLLYWKFWNWLKSTQAISCLSIQGDVSIEEAVFSLMAKVIVKSLDEESTTGSV